MMKMNTYIIISLQNTGIIDTMSLNWFSVKVMKVLQYNNESV